MKNFKLSTFIGGIFIVVFSCIVCKYVLIGIAVGGIVALTVYVIKKLKEKCYDNEIVHKQIVHKSNTVRDSSPVFNYEPIKSESKIVTPPNYDAIKAEIPKSNITEIKYQRYQPSITDTVADTMPQVPVFTFPVYFNDDVVQKLSKRYIAFDVETTGLNSYYDRIVEIGAVLFENGVPTNEFSTLVNPNIHISSSATAINHITNKMLMEAPTEQEVYPKLINFLGDALTGQTLLCAHNARFDMGFLSETLIRLGYNAENISYVDTLKLSRQFIKNIDNHKQPTVAKYFNICNDKEHRADSDAKVCGMILSKILLLHKDELDKIKAIKEQQELEKLMLKELKQKEKQAAKEQEKLEKQMAKELEKAEKLAAKELEKSDNTNTHGKRAIYQLNDEMFVLKKFDSVSEAVNETKINSKSIRDAAKGIQKHAGGFVWRYADEYIDKFEE